MGAGDNKKVCCEAATAPQILGLEKRQHPIIGETNVFRFNIKAPFYSQAYFGFMKQSERASGN